MKQNTTATQRQRPKQKHIYFYRNQSDVINANHKSCRLHNPLNVCISSDEAPHKFGAPLCRGGKREGAEAGRVLLHIEAHNSLIPAIPHPRHRAVALHNYIKRASTDFIVWQ